MEQATTSAIIRFSRKRGRPKNEQPQHDCGTPELAFKRLRGDTMETLDLCLERELITRRQHWCGIHLRWLYTLRYGAPSLRALDPTHVSGLELSEDDPDWRRAREDEYHEAMRALNPGGYALLLINICVHNERPAFLQYARRMHTNAGIMADNVKRLQNGLTILVKLWER